ncbi:MAG TPA: hypothetical protein VH439_10940 [Gemmatimonadales bacterium]|jgi:hypothetical protein
MATKTAQDLRDEADRIEAAEFKAERLADANTIPTCPNCGGRVFNIAAWTIVSQSISFEDDTDDGDWCDDYQSGDHTDESSSAECRACGADVEEVLERFGWSFYDGPTRRTPEAQPKDCAGTKDGIVGTIATEGQP